MAGSMTKGIRELTVFLGGMEKQAGKAVTGTVSKYGMEIFRGVVQRSPVDKGMFRGSWDTLEEGSKKGEKPWPNAGPKTVEVDGRIYSSQAPGGIVDPVMEKVNVSGLMGAIEVALRMAGLR
jgi:hypothetical protein